MTLATADLDAILAALDAAEGLADFARTWGWQHHFHLEIVYQIDRQGITN